MAIPDQGRAGWPQTHRFRLDGMGGATASVPASGRRFVIAAVLAVLAVWGGLYLIFLSWRADYGANADFGSRYVATTIGPLEAKVPPGLDPEAWRDAVGETRVLLVAVTSAGVMDADAMQTLRIDLAARIRAARPETALAELLRIWRWADTATGPVASRARRPAFIEAAGLVAPLEPRVPAAVEKAAWLKALADARVLIAHRAATGLLSPADLDRLARAIAASPPDASLAALARTWDAVAGDGPPPVPRPALLDPARAAAGP